MEEMNFVEAARSVMKDRSGGSENIYKDIFEFILKVLRQAAGLDPKINENAAGASSKKEIPIPIYDWFYRVNENALDSGDFVLYQNSANRETMGLVESYDPVTKTGKMFAMDESKGEVSSLDFGEGDLQGASFVRPNMDLVMVNLAGLFAGMDEYYDEDEYMGPSDYPSPSP